MGHWIDHSLSYLTFQPLLNNWCNKVCCMHYPVYGMVYVKYQLVLTGNAGPNSAVAMSSANGMVGIGFASRYRLQPRAVF